jgi:hypothetical protein
MSNNKPPNNKPPTRTTDKEPFKRLLNVAEETEEEIINSFRKESEENDVFLAIIMPYIGAKIAPSKRLMASIGFSEEFGIETAINKIKETAPKPNRLYLVINTFGGGVNSSYKVARALKMNFKDITVFIPHIAASGGTLIALTGNQIVMGTMSHISPLDPQVRGTSALSVARGFKTVDDFFKETSEEEAPYTYKALANNYNAIMLDEAMANLNLMKKYVREILTPKYPKIYCNYIAARLVEGFYTHDDVITREEAQKLGLNAVPHTEHPKLWETFRILLDKYILTSESRHIIRYWVHTKQKEENQNESKEERQK